MEPDGSSPHSQYATCPYHEPHRSNLYPHSTFRISILILCYPTATRHGPLIIREAHAFDVLLQSTVGLTPSAIQQLRITALYFPADGNVSYCYAQRNFDSVRHPSAKRQCQIISCEGGGGEHVRSHYYASSYFTATRHDPFIFTDRRHRGHTTTRGNPLIPCATQLPHVTARKLFPEKEAHKLLLRTLGHSLRSPTKSYATRLFISW
jgi:hypothetical protein